MTSTFASPDTAMSPRTATRQPAAVPASRRHDPVYQAFWLLRTLFTVAPVAFGVDKFFHVLVDWDGYLAPVLARQLPWTPHQIMYLVGAVEIVAGLVVALRPRLGGYIVAAWLAGIIVNLLLIPGFYDVALRDFGLFVAALALTRLAIGFTGSPRRSNGRD
jgi:hypothetical protein